MERDKKQSARTLLSSVLLSAPGPLILGLGLRVGHSSTQLADFLRRTAELTALIVAFAVYASTNRGQADEERRQILERRGNLFSGAIMCLSGVCMLAVTLLSEEGDKGNVIPALVIALLGAATNIFFWRRYTSLYQRQGNSILGVQGRLYGAKSCVDVCVSAALAAVLVFPGAGVSAWLDRIGSALVSLYMLRCGVRTIREQR